MLILRTRSTLSTWSSLPNLSWTSVIRSHLLTSKKGWELGKISIYNKYSSFIKNTMSLHILGFLLNECTGCHGIPGDNLVGYYSGTSFLLHPLPELPPSFFLPPPLWLFMNGFKCYSQNQCRILELSWQVYLR